MADLVLDPQHTALVLIDLQKGVVGMPITPNSAEDVVARSARLAAAFRKAGAFVVLVRVASVDGKDMLRPTTDQAPPSAARPEGWSEIVPELGPRDNDFVLTKRNWGAFHGTELDLQLRRRGIRTLVLGGIATGIGVDTTAREAYQLGYDQVFVPEAMAALSDEEHQYVTGRIFPRMGRIRTVDEVLQAIGG